VKVSAVKNNEPPKPRPAVMQRERSRQELFQLLKQRSADSNKTAL